MWPVLAEVELRTLKKPTKDNEHIILLQYLIFPDTKMAVNV
jgi:hypothetical protein